MAVASRDVVESRSCWGCCGKEGQVGGEGKRHETAGKGHPRSYRWAERMKRVWGFDVLRCDCCGGRMRILCAINPPEAIQRILDCLGLPSRPPPISAAAPDRAFED